MRIADERRVITANERPVQRRTYAFVCLRADDDESPDGTIGQDRLERCLLERVRITLGGRACALVDRRPRLEPYSERSAAVGLSVWLPT